MSTQQTPLDTFVGAGQTYVVQSGYAPGETVTVCPVRLRQLAPFTRAVLPLVDALKAFAPQADALPESTALAGLDVPMLLERHTPNVMQAIGICTGKNEVWAGELDIADVAELVGLVIEVNADFFIQRLRPVMSRLIPHITQRLATAAQT